MAETRPGDHALVSIPADTNHDGHVEVSELYRAVKRALRNGQQTPWLAVTG